MGVADATASTHLQTGATQFGRFNSACAVWPFGAHPSARIAHVAGEMNAVVEAAGPARRDKGACAKGHLSELNESSIKRCNGRLPGSSGHIHTSAHLLR